MAADSDVTITLRANLKDYEAALKSAVRATERAAQTAEKAVSGIGKTARPGNVIAVDFQKSAAQIQNDARVMQFQLNDIFSGLASGQGIRAVQQQLGQIAQQMSGQTLRQGAATMGAALVGMINPINLAVVAFGVAATAATSYFFDSEEGAKDSEAALKKEKQAIDAALDAWQDLLPTLAAVRKAREEALTAQGVRAGAEQEIQKQFEPITAKIKDIVPQLSDVKRALREINSEEADAAIRAFNKSVAELLKKSVDGTANVKDLDAILKTLSDSLKQSVNPEVVALGTAVDKIRKPLADVAEGAKQIRTEAEQASEKQKVFNETLEKLRDIAKGHLSDAEKLIQLYNTAIGAMGQLDDKQRELMERRLLPEFNAARITVMNKELQTAVDLILQFEGGLVSVAKQQEPGGAFRAGFSSDTITDPKTGAFRAVRAGDVVNLEQATADLVRRIQEGRVFLSEQIGRTVLESLNEDQKAVLDSLVYNYGNNIKTLGPIFAKIREGELGAAAETIATLATGPHFPKVLRERRQREAAIFARGNVPAEQTLKEADAARKANEEAAEATRKANENLQNYLRSLDEQASLQVRINEINTTSTLNADQKRIAIEVETELQKALNQARQDGITLTDADIAKIREKAIANAQAGNAALAISEAEKAAAKEAADAAAAAIKAAQDQKQAMDNLRNTIASMATSALTGFVQDLRNGTDAAEALYNAVSRIADQLLQMALQKMFMMALGGFQGGGFVPSPGGGLYASGGFTGPGPASQPAGVVHAGEFVINAQATKRHRAMLEAMNKGIPGYAAGGFVLPNLRGMAQRMPTSQAAAAAANVRVPVSVVNTFDAGSFLSEALSKPEGAKVVLNLVRSQPGAFRQAMQG